MARGEDPPRHPVVRPDDLGGHVDVDHRPVRSLVRELYVERPALEERGEKPRAVLAQLVRADQSDRLAMELAHGPSKEPLVRRVHVEDPSLEVEERDRDVEEVDRPAS